MKYETPTGQRNGIDVPPGVGPALDDPTVPLWVTEGCKKADSAVCAGLACVALAGVWSWIGANGHGGKTAVADWHDIALNGRPVVLAFDSDAVRKRSVRQALDQLAGYLAAKGATVRYLHLPYDDDAKTGLDDYLAGHTVEELHELVRPEPPEVVEVELPAVVETVPTVAAAPFVGSGADLLDDVYAFLGRFVAYPSEAAHVAHTLWTPHTHLMAAWESTPRIAFLSPEPGSGKTRALEASELLVPNPVESDGSGVSAAGAASKTEATNATASSRLRVTIGCSAGRS